MGPSIRVAGAAVLLTLLPACTSSAGQHPTSSPGRVKTATASTSPTTVPATFARESGRAIRECGVKREFDTTGVPNPCEQAEHLHSLFARNKEWDSRHGFTIHVGGIGTCGIRLTVDGDVTAARQTFGSDPLVARVTTDDEGFPPDC